MYSVLLYSKLTYGITNTYDVASVRVFIISLLQFPFEEQLCRFFYDDHNEFCRSVEDYTANDMFLNMEKVRERSPLLSKNGHNMSHNELKKICREDDIDAKLFDDRGSDIMTNLEGVHILADCNDLIPNKHRELIRRNVLLINTEDEVPKYIQLVNTGMVNGTSEKNDVYVRAENTTNYTDGADSKYAVSGRSEINCTYQQAVNYNFELDIPVCGNHLNNIQPCFVNDDENFNLRTEYVDPVNGASDLKEVTVDLSDTLVEPRKRTNNVITKKTINNKIPLHPGLRLSLFPGVPPYILFHAHDKKGTQFPPLIHKQLRWKMSTITPAVVKQVVTNSGFRLLKKSTEWGGTWGKHVKSVCFRTVHDHQKMNHFPGTFQLGRKDRLWKNVQKFMLKFGIEEFGFMPATYIVPHDIKSLRSVWEDKETEKWIVKPPASARGVGIKVIHKWCQIPRKTPMVVQRYISDPYLINGTKFDLRLYILVTSFNPLRLYMYDNGLVRFASVKYSSDLNSLTDRYMHLTNYSINKLSTEYTHNEDVDACHGHKWTVKTLWNYLEKEYNVDTNVLWNRLTDLVVKTIISTESPINKLVDANRNSGYNCYELFGVDVLFDQQLKPWLLEVNISPSLHSSSPLDLAVKGPVVQNLFNMVGFQIPPNKKCNEKQMKRGLGTKLRIPVCYDKRLYITLLSPAEKEKHLYFEQITCREEYLNDILKELTPDDVRHLVQYEDELTQAGSFCRIFPTPETHNYFKFFDAPKYYNYLLDAWETRYHDCRQEGIILLKDMCSKGVHSDVSLVNDNTATIYKIHQKCQPKKRQNNLFRLKYNRRAAVNFRWIYVGSSK